MNNPIIKQNKFYAMIASGHQGTNFGDVMLVDKRIGDLIINYFERDLLKNDIKEEDWYFLESEFQIEATDYDKFPEDETVPFAFYLEREDFSCNLNENYYAIEKLKSSISFNGISELFEYVKNNKIEIIGDLI